MRTKHLLSVLTRKCHTKVSGSPEKIIDRGSWRSLIGLEIHAQLSTESKLFSSSKYQYAAPVNAAVSLFDAAIPGTLPVLNKKSVELAVLSSLALKCDINPLSYFDRKHYFYSDLPAGYQITQQRLPLAVNGSVDYTVYQPGYHKTPYKKSSKIKQIQIEQDSGKSLHDKENGVSYIDLNRSNVGLIEIVFEPNLVDGEEAVALVKEIIMILQRAGTCSCKLQEGAFRVDANVSIHKEGDEYGVRTEIKNLGSIRAIADAVEYETNRQLGIISNGGTVINETLSWNADECKTVVMRDKEEKQDYRFMPEPNLPPLRVLVDEKSRKFHENVITRDFVLDLRHLKQQIPKMPQDDRNYLMEKYEILEVQAFNLVNSNKLFSYFEAIMESKKGRNGRRVYHILLTMLLKVLSDKNIEVENCPISTSVLGEVVDLYDDRKVNNQGCLTLIEELLSGNTSTPSEIIREKNLEEISNPEEIKKHCSQVIKENSKLVKKFIKGDAKATSTMHKKVQKLLEGRGDNQIITQVLMELLEKEKSA